MRCGTLGTRGHVTAKSSICGWGVLHVSGVYARKALCLTPGGLHGVYGNDRVSSSEPHARGNRETRYGETYVTSLG